MPDDYLEASGELDSIKKPKKKIKHPMRIVVDVLLVIVFAIIIAISANVIYLSVAFGEGFFVNGASMYPTLNADGWTFRDGQKRTLTWTDKVNYAKGDMNLSEGDYVDYGYGISKDGFINNLKRYDIVMTYYPSDYSDAPTYDKLVSGASLKIKRIVGLPGETVDIAPSGDANEVWGVTKITKAGSTEEETLKNLYTLKDFPDIVTSTGTKKYPNGGVFQSRVITLAADEYFLCGDNRYHSQDSRAVGAIKAKMIKGQACLITSLRQLDKDSQGNMVPKFRLSTIRMPWNYIDLRKH